MIVKGRSRSNGAQLADYLENSKGNDLVTVLEVRGTTKPENLRLSLVEMSMSSELTKRGKLGLYHSQVNPAIGEDRPMTPADWLRAADILEEHLGFTGQKRAIVLHEKEGRIHGHIVWEKYDHDTGKLRTDSKNYEKHDKARAQIERELGHERTPQKPERDLSNKARLTELWQQHQGGQEFVEAARQAGYEIAQGNDRRPFRVITPDSQSLELPRQLDGFNAKDVRDRLQPIRADLLTEAEALKLSKIEREAIQQREQPQPEHSDNSSQLSESQDRMEAMKTYYKQTVEPENTQPKGYSYGFTFTQAPALPRHPVPEIESDNLHELSDSQDLAVAMIERHRQRSAAHQPPPVQPRMDAANDNLSDIEKLKLQQQQARARGHRRGGYKR